MKFRRQALELHPSLIRRAPCRRLPRQWRNPTAFGRGRALTIGDGVTATGSRLGDDLKLFATTFAGGFLFVTLLIA